MKFPLSNTLGKHYLENIWVSLLEKTKQTKNAFDPYYIGVHCKSLNA